MNVQDALILISHSLPPSSLLPLAPRGQPFPELSRIPGVVLSGRAFAHCLTVVEFLHSYGKVLGLQIPKDVPSLCTLQEGLLGIGESQGEVMDLLIKLVEAALHDPGLPSYYQVRSCVEC